MVLEGLSEALHVSIEWLRGETDEYETDITDKKELQIRDAMGDILKQLPLSKKEDATLLSKNFNLGIIPDYFFQNDLLLLMLNMADNLFQPVSFGIIPTTRLIYLSSVPNIERRHTIMAKDL